jgi:hypothetical protein
VTVAEQISTIASAAFIFMGMSGRWVKNILKEIRALLTELKHNTQAITDLGIKVDVSQSDVMKKLTDHETRISTLEGKDK